MSRYVLLIILLASSMPFAHAHDPGLSRALVQLHDMGLSIEMVYAVQDLEMLVPMDGNLDGHTGTDEFLAARPRLYPVIQRSVRVLDAGNVVQPGRIHLEQVPDDAVRIRLDYHVPSRSALTLQVPLLDRLARGHRQYLVVEDSNGEPDSQYILAAGSPPVAVRHSDNQASGVFRDFFVEGVWHIWIGFDHILFLITLLLPAVLVYRSAGWEAREALRPAVTDILKVVTAFTLAHSITLALAVLELVSPPSRLVETVIAFSVLVTAINNLRPVFPSSRWLLAFGFGLVHGFGFAGVLMELGLPGDARVLSLLGFNLGVEAGQLAIVLLLFPAAAVLRYTRLYRHWLFNGGSTAAAIIAATWMIERIAGLELPGP